MDASDTRRGRPATHRAFGAEHRGDGWRGDPEQYGAAAAILLGDLLLGWSDEMLRRCGLPWDRVGPALDLFDRCRSEVIAGQFLDVSVQARGRADVDTAMTVLRYKSAKYSIERPLHIGAALAGAGPATLEALSSFGLPLGEAFQLRDDLLGVFGDPETTGKPAGDDLIEGKRTVLVALALDAASPADAAVLDEALGRRLSLDEVEELRRIIDSSGAQAQVEQVIEELARLAVGALDVAAIDDTAREVLRELASAATQRVRLVEARQPQVGALAAEQHAQRGRARPQDLDGRGERALLGSCQRRPGVPQQDRPLVAAGDVGQAVLEGVHGAGVVLRQGQGLGDGFVELRRSLHLMAVEIGEPPPGVLHGMLHVGDVICRVPSVDAGRDVVGQYSRETAHRSILLKDV